MMLAWRRAVAVVARRIEAHGPVGGDQLRTAMKGGEALTAAAPANGAPRAFSAAASRIDCGRGFAGAISGHGRRFWVG
eukprot:CAMPEP_0198694646 /NCGR_PEP_ID=MMETSP1468-20131203/273475_1 /TAXON_ID=1461545 /ORGANISM="Mantoniella sp, Strain CCMP1436" /LENGTH=77 /DNA_ID=CAMNT_0044449943 /DNA_START=182 /DNA_END=411 /DNA_ORIENTATION=-